MKNKHSSKCQTCSGQLSSKKPPPRPYGAKGTNPWCHNCDRDYVYDVSKTSERMKSKKQIRREIEDNQ